MSLYRRGGVWWYKFRFGGQVIRESSKSMSRTVAREAERARRREIEQGFNGITRAQRAQMFSIVSEAWVKAQAAHLAPRSVMIEKANLQHLNSFFGRMLLCDITADDIAQYQAERLKQKTFPEAADPEKLKPAAKSKRPKRKIDPKRFERTTSPKTINLETGTLRAILRKNRLWAQIQPDVRVLKTNENIGRAISREEETKLLEACRSSRSRSLHTSVVLALNTCMRFSEIRLLKWWQVDFVRKEVVVGKSKTESGTGRIIPLNDRAYAALEFWGGNFLDRSPDSYVFPSERYGAAGDDFRACVYQTDPSKPIGRWKEAWEAAKERAKVNCRFHDLRHTGCTRMLEGGVPLSVVAAVMGWSASTTVRMAKRYGHIGQDAQRQAVAMLNKPISEGDGAQNWAQSEKVENAGAIN